jgi:hypothetical protein
MLLRRARVCCFLVLLALSVLTGVVYATPFTILPDGDLVIDSTFTTKGVFTCIGIVAPPCCGSGSNSVVLRSGTNAVAVTFLGASITFPMVAQVGATLPVGQFVTTSPSGIYETGSHA